MAEKPQNLVRPILQQSIEGTEMSTAFEELLRPVLAQVAEDGPEWTLRDFLELIAFWESYPETYDVFHPLYGDRATYEQACRNIARCLATPRRELEIQRVLSQLQRVWREMRGSLPARTDGDDRVACSRTILTLLNFLERGPRTPATPPNDSPPTPEDAAEGDDCEDAEVPDMEVNDPPENCPPKRVRRESLSAENGDDDEAFSRQVAAELRRLPQIRRQGAQLRIQQVLRDASSAREPSQVVQNLNHQENKAVGESSEVSKVKEDECICESSCAHNSFSNRQELGSNQQQQQTNHNCRCPFRMFLRFPPVPSTQYRPPIVVPFQQSSAPRVVPTVYTPTFPTSSFPEEYWSLLQQQWSLNSVFDGNLEPARLVMSNRSMPTLLPSQNYTLPMLRSPPARVSHTVTSCPLDLTANPFDSFSFTRPPQLTTSPPVHVVRTNATPDRPPPSFTPGVPTTSTTFTAPSAAPTSTVVRESCHDYNDKSN